MLKIILISLAVLAGWIIIKVTTRSCLFLNSEQASRLQIVVHDKAHLKWLCREKKMNLFRTRPLLGLDLQQAKIQFNLDKAWARRAGISSFRIWLTA